MGLGLAGPSKKSKIGFDPRNTTWSNDTDRFGHQHMLNMGWRPGQGLGKTVKGDIHHVKVKVKADNVGLGRPIKDDMPTGLDVFQRILGKLNGEEEKVNRQLNEQMKMSGVFLNFVYGGVLEGTVEKMNLPQIETTDSERALKKRSAPESDSESGSEPEQKKSKSHRSKEKKPKKIKERKDKKDKKSKDKKEKKEKKEIKEKKEKKSKNDKKSDKKSTESKEISAPISRESTSSPAPMGIRATRSRFIAMKRQATTDEKSLKEILMLT